MRTTIELPDELLRQAKIRATMDGTSLKQFFVAALEQKLAPAPKPQRRKEPPVIGNPNGPKIPDLTQEQVEDAILGSADEFLPRGR